MADESIISDENGKPTHIRETSDDGRKSTLYEYDDGLLSDLFGTNKGAPVERTDHHADGTTDAYEYDGGFFAGLLNDNRGAKKSGAREEAAANDSTSDRDDSYSGPSSSNSSDFVAYIPVAVVLLVIVAAIAFPRSSKDTREIRYNALDGAVEYNNNVITHDSTLSPNRRYGVIAPDFEKERDDEGASDRELSQEELQKMFEAGIERKAGQSENVNSKPYEYIVNGISKDDELMVREGPGQNFKKVGSIKPMTRGIHIISEGVTNDADLWIKIKVGRIEGWVNSIFLKAIPIKSGNFFQRLVGSIKGGNPNSAPQTRTNIFEGEKYSQARVGLISAAEAKTWSYSQLRYAITPARISSDIYQAAAA